MPTGGQLGGPSRGAWNSMIRRVGNNDISRKKKEIADLNASSGPRSHWYSEEKFAGEIRPDREDGSTIPAGHQGIFWRKVTGN
jgi:hypothetical protein